MCVKHWTQGLRHGREGRFDLGGMQLVRAGGLPRPLQEPTTTWPLTSLRRSVGVDDENVTTGVMDEAVRD